MNSWRAARSKPTLITDRMEAVVVGRKFEPIEPGVDGKRLHGP
jgi:hypothetical protein